MTERGMRIWIGVFVVGSLVLLAWLIILFGSAPNIFKSTALYKIRFADAQGIGPGSPVRRSGVRIGEVRDVILSNEDNDVRVDVAIDRRYTLRDTDEAVVVTSLLGGDATIDIIPKPTPDRGQPPLVSKPIEPGGEIQGIRQPTFNTVLNQASGVVPTAQETLNDIRKSVQSVEKAIPVFEATMKEYQELAKDLRQVTPSLKQTSDDIQAITKEVRKAVPSVTRTSEELGQLARGVREALPTAQQTLKDVGELSQEARKAMPGLSKTSDEIQQLAKEARTKTLPSITRTSDEIRELTREFRGVPAEPKKGMGDVEVSVKGAEARQPVQDNQGVPAQMRKALEELGATARVWGKVGERVDVFVQTNQDKLVKALENLNDALTRISNTFSDSNQTNLTEALRGIRAASGNFDSISRNVDYITTEGRTTVRRLNSTLERTEQLMKDLQGTTNQQGGRIGSISKNLDESLEKLNSVLSDVRTVVRNVGQADGTISRLLTDPSLYNKIDEAVCNLPRMTARLERILKDFEVFADKLARHPELIGVGGAVRGSTGLKESPVVAPPHSSYYPPR